MPSKEAILQRYMAKFSKGVQKDLNDDDLHVVLGLVNEDGESPVDGGDFVVQGYR